MWWENTESRTMRILVCGGRDFINWKLLCGELDDRLVSTTQEECEKFHIIQGGATGADFLAKVWAYDSFPYSFESRHTEFIADWKKHGSQAGPIRNQQMIDEGKPDLVVAFPTPKSKGTWDMIRRAEKAGIETIVVKHEQNS